MRNLDFKPVVVVHADDPAYAKYNPPAASVCEYCGAKFYPCGLYSAELDKVFWTWKNPKMCDCAGRTDAAEAERLKAKTAEFMSRETAKREAIRFLINPSAGVSPRFASRTFATFTVSGGNKQAANLAKTFTARFEDYLPIAGKNINRNGLMLVGDKGVGKTHLSAAIVNKLAATSYSVLYFTAAAMLSKVKEKFDSEVMELLKGVSLLVIDDLGKQQPTEWSVSTLFEIVNARYESCLPTVITSNYGAEELAARLTPKDDPITAEALVDRLREMCVSVAICGESWRRK